MDVRMPGISGMEAARRLSARGNPAVVVLVSADEGPAEPLGDDAPVVVPKCKLCRSLLTRLWEERAVALVTARA
jgi:CheY-like chemotaxis protein